VFTSGDEGELFLNGRSLGRKKKGSYEYRLRWDDVVYEPGTLKVITYRNGQIWATDEVRTAGAPAMLVLAPVRAEIRADGRDLAFVTLTVTDKDGSPAPRADNRIHFDLDGPGEIVATDNGDPTSLEPFPAHDRKAFNGLCLVIVRGLAGKSGKISIVARAEGLVSGTAIVQTTPDSPSEPP
jgi:beta-galactosidase